MLTTLNALQVLVFHSLAFAIGYLMIRTSSSGSDGIPVARCISLETGMQVLCCASIHITTARLQLTACFLHTNTLVAGWLAR